jgi:hypothetical protein
MSRVQVFGVQVFTVPEYCGSGVAVFACSFSCCGSGVVERRCGIQSVVVQVERYTVLQCCSSRIVVQSVVVQVLGV